MLMSSEEIHLFDTSLLLLCRNRRLTVEQQAAKRLDGCRIVSAAGVVDCIPHYAVDCGARSRHMTEARCFTGSQG